MPAWLWLGVLLIVFPSCSTGGGRAASQPNTPAAATAGPAGMDSGRRLVDLNPAERAALCDWSASVVGGYGSRYYCPNLVFYMHPTREACIASRAKIVSTCAATVADSQACAMATQENLCGAPSVSECAGRLIGCAPTPSAQLPLLP